MYAVISSLFSSLGFSGVYLNAVCLLFYRLTVDVCCMFQG